MAVGTDAHGSNLVEELNDPIFPLLWIGQNLLLKMAAQKSLVPEDLVVFDRGATLLRDGAVPTLERHGARYSTDDLAVITAAADQIDAMRAGLADFGAQPFDATQADALRLRIETQLHPAVRHSLNVVRKLFVQIAIDRERQHTAQTATAINGLNQISRQIFSISVNASVEAARAGEAGRGFLQISTDMRALSQSASDATRTLSDLVKVDARRI